MVISGEHGKQNGEHFVSFEMLVKKMGDAEIGASLALVDAGFALNDLQVGQMGKVVPPDLYIAVYFWGGR